MFFTVYKITNTSNGKIYIGAHKTNDLEDGYMSSSELVKAAISKYGKDKFSKEILFLCESEDDMFRKERELVNAEFVQRSDTYNIKCGGNGSWSHWHGSPEHKAAAIKGGLQTIGSDRSFKGRRTKANFALSEETQRKASIAATSASANEKRKSTYREIKHQKGEKNSQYGKKVYINTTTLEKKRFIEGEHPEGWMTTIDYKEKLRKDKPPTRRWFNDGEKNFYLFEHDDQIRQLGLSFGRKVV